MGKAAEKDTRIAAIVLAAGMSTRMGQQKLLLPWGKETVISQIIGTIQKAGLIQIIVVTGKEDRELNLVLSQLPITQVINSDYANGSMVTSLQKGLAAIQDKNVAAFMIFLGDQPTVQVDTIHSIIEAYLRSGSDIVIPSFQLHQGHPWLIDRKLWVEIQNLTSENTMKDFLAQRKKSIQYVIVDSPTVLQDMDTPEEFRKIKPA
jgi:CTP:molybdopterin cytidylyltransferase MocA